MTDTSTPLSLPLYGASFGEAVGRFFTKYFSYSGRASRSEYWWVIFFRFLVFLAVAAVLGGIIAATREIGYDGEYQLSVAGIIALGIAVVVYLGFELGTISLGVRRLHDADLSGLLYLLALVPNVGGLVVFILTLLPSKPAGARFDSPGAVGDMQSASTPVGSPTLEQ